MSYELIDGGFLCEINEISLELKLTYRNMHRLDKELNNINTFLMRASQNNISLDNIISILYWGAKKNHPKMNKEDIGEMIFDHGTIDAQILAVQFLAFAMNGGKELDESDVNEDDDKKKST